MPQRAEIEEAFAGIYKRGYFANNGPLVKKLDAELARRLGASFGVSVANEMTGMMLLANAVFQKGEVIAPASIGNEMREALRYAGVEVAFADIDREQFHLDLDSVRRLVGPRTIGIVGVYPFGRLTGADDLERLARHLGLPLIFDGSDALGGSFLGRGVGDFGLGAVLSLSERTVLNAAQGGFIVTKSEPLARHTRTSRNFHQGETYVDDVLRLNAKMAESSAALALLSLTHLDEWIEGNRERASIYREIFDSVKAIRFIPFDEEASNYARVVVEVKVAGLRRSADALSESLYRQGFAIRPALRPCEPSAAVRAPVVEGLSERLIELPNHFAMSENDVLSVARAFTMAVRA